MAAVANGDAAAAASDLTHVVEKDPAEDQAGLATISADGRVRTGAQADEEVISRPARPEGAARSGEHRAIHRT